MTADLVIRGATVIDGTGAPSTTTDVAVEGDRIVSVGEHADRAATEIDGSGLTLTPGFIDTHTHDDFAALLYPEMGFKVEGGVTTCVVGNCGMGAAPWKMGRIFAKSFHPNHELTEWDGYAGYLDRLDGEGVSVNIAALIGHGTVRAGAMFMDDRPPTPAELDAMRAMVTEGMEAGAVGMSSGLIYPPGKFAATDELIDLAGVVAEHGGIYTSHIRDEAAGLLDAVDEAIAIGGAAGLPVVISHLKASGKPYWGSVAAALDRIDAAGPTVAADQYPYTAGSTVLSAVVGASGMGRLEPDDVVIASTDHHPEWHGRSLADLARILDVSLTDVEQVVLDAEPACTVILHTMCEDDVRHVMAHPGIMIGSDGIPSLEGQPHPRLYGTFARVLGHYSRDEGVLPFEEAVHRMTGRSAEVFGLADRGVIRAGAFADLVLFDADAIIDRATYDDPHHPPAGIRGVWVNGTRVVDDGRHTSARPGRTLRHR